MKNIHKENEKKSETREERKISMMKVNIHSMDTVLELCTKSGLTTTPFRKAHN
jgi:hypothetical protein